MNVPGDAAAELVPRGPGVTESTPRANSREVDGCEYNPGVGLGPKSVDGVFIVTRAGVVGCCVQAGELGEGGPGRPGNSYMAEALDAG
jgi:hypothetical protein